MCELRAWRFNIPLKNEILLKQKAYSIREGVLLERDGVWSEASPLPEFSRETIDDVIVALREDRRPTPALQFALAALEQSVLEPITVPVNYLLMGDRKQVIANANECVKKGCIAAKLKVGRSDLARDIDLVNEVREALPATVQLRLDANRAWNFEDAVYFAEAIQRIDIEYIEEPLRDPQHLEELYFKTGIRYALDETLLHHTVLEKWPNAAALICKPTILGGRDAVERLANTGKPIVFSSAFESGIGITRIAQLAAEYSPGIAVGVDTLGWLGSDLLLDSPQKKGGDITFFPNPKAKVSSLERIEL